MGIVFNEKVETCDDMVWIFYLSYQLRVYLLKHLSYQLKHVLRVMSK